jgi:hypothetical protein
VVFDMFFKFFLSCGSIVCIEGGSNVIVELNEIAGSSSKAEQPINGRAEGILLCFDDIF